MQRDYMLHYSKTESGTTAASGPGFINDIEPLEQPGQVFFLYSDSCIGNNNCDNVLSCPDPYSLATLPSILNGILEGQQ